MEYAVFYPHSEHEMQRVSGWTTDKIGALVIKNRMNLDEEHLIGDDYIVLSREELNDHIIALYEQMGRASF